MKRDKISRNRHIIFVLSVILLSVAWSQLGAAATSKPTIRTKVEYNRGQIVFQIEVEADHHITDLKNGFFKIEAEENPYLQITNISFPDPEPYHDELVFKGTLAVTVFVKTIASISEPTTVNFRVGYQICQEMPQEMCYPPEEMLIPVEIQSDFSAVSGIIKQEAREKDESVSKKDESYSDWMERIIKQELESRSILLFLLVFVAGFLTSLTPCVYPVIPIVMGYIGTRSGKKKLKGFYLSLFFVLGLAIVYSVFGVIAAKSGAMMGVSFQNPVVVIIIAAIFIVMGLSLAGLFEIPVPASISSKIQSNYKSEVLGAMIIGGISGIIAAPCVGPVLIALLSWISQTGNIFLGFWLTFVFSLGMGVIFLIAGTFSGAISALPKGGHWMSTIKYLFAVLLIGGGIYFLTTITAGWLGLLLWGLFLITISTFMGLFQPLEEGDGTAAKSLKLLAVIIFLIGAFLFFNGLQARYFPTPVTQLGVEAAPGLPWIKDLEAGRAQAKLEGKALMIDTTAEWCVACKELDKYTFSDPDVAAALESFILVKLDFTENSDENTTLRQSLGVIGMPTIIFFNSDGSESGRFSGFKNRDKFLAFLDGIK